MRIMDFMKSESRTAPNEYPISHLFSFPLSTSISRPVRLILGVLAFAYIASAQATVTSLSFQPSPTDMSDLDHHLVYTWRIDSVSLGDLALTGATLSITNISNWDTNPNVLHLHLLDTVVNGNVASFVDDPTGHTPVTDLTDDFISTRYHSDSNWLVKTGTADTLLDDPSFTTTGVNYSLNFTPSQLQTLNSCIANGNDLAFGLDPDCHFFNDGIKFTMALSPVPEMSAIYPIISLIAAVAFTRILRRRSAQRVMLANSRIEENSVG
jgi:hypothetical protein